MPGHHLFDPAPFLGLEHIAIVLGDLPQQAAGILEGEIEPRHPLLEQADLLRFMGADRLLAKPLWGLAADWTEHYKWVGDVLLERNARSVQKAIKGAFRFKSDKGTRVIMFDSTGLSSDVAEACGEEFDLVIGFGYTSDDPTLPPKIILSTRSHTTFDCAAFVQRFGGGGHTKAAGCTIVAEPLETTPNPYILVRDLLNLHEKG